MSFLIGLLFIMAFDENILQKPQVFAVEPRLYNPRKDLTVFASLLPLDAFTKGLGGGVTYTMSLNSAWSWQIINVSYYSNWDTGLKDRMRQLGVTPKWVLDFVNACILTHIYYAPIYSKNLIGNRKIIYGSLAFFGGAGMLLWRSRDTSPMIGGGIEYRFFQSHKISHKFSLGIYGHMSSEKSTDFIMTMNYGLSFEFGDHSSWEN